MRRTAGGAESRRRPTRHAPGGVQNAPGMRLLVIGSTYPPDELGGYELLCAEHVGWLRRRGHEVSVLTSIGDGRGGTAVGPSGETVVRALDLHWHRFRHRPPSGAAMVAAERRQRRVLEHLLDHGVDGVLVWQMAAISKSLLGVLARRRLPVVAVIGEPWPVWDIAQDGWFSACRRLPRRMRVVADRVIAPCDRAAAMAGLLPAYASDHLRVLCEGAVPEWAGRGAVVRNGIDAALFEVARADDAPMPTPLRCLYAGRIEPRKGVHVGLTAVALLDAAGVAATLTIRGWADHDYEVGLRAIAAERGIEGLVRFEPPVARERMRDVYADHDVVLFPTLWEEPFGLVPLEAMAAGCVVAATGSGGSGEYLADGVNSVLSPRDDPPALAGRLLTLAADPAMVARLRRGGRETVAAHSFERFAAGLERLAGGGEPLERGPGEAPAVARVAASR